MTGLIKNYPSRPTVPKANRSTHRARTEPTANNPRRITASIVIPALGIDRRPPIRWAQPVVQKQTQSGPFRLSAQGNPPPIMHGGRSMERAASTSLPDLPLNSQHIQS